MSFRSTVPTSANKSRRYGPEYHESSRKKSEIRYKSPITSRGDFQNPSLISQCRKRVYYGHYPRKPSSEILRQTFGTPRSNCGERTTDEDILQEI